MFAALAANDSVSSSARRSGFAAGTTHTAPLSTSRITLEPGAPPHERQQVRGRSDERAASVVPEWTTTGVVGM